MTTVREIIRRSEIHYLRLIVVLLIASAFVSVSNVFITQVTGIISDAAAASETAEITRMLLVLAGLTALKLLASALSTIYMRRSQGQLEYGLRRDFVAKLTGISLGDLLRKGSGNLVSLFSNDLPPTAQVLTTDLFSFISEAMLLIVAAIFMFRLEPWYTLAFLVLFPPLAWMQVRISQPLGGLYRQVSLTQGAYNAVISDSLQNTNTIVAYSLEQTMQQRYQGSYESYLEAMRRYASKFVVLVCSGVFATFLPVLFIYVVIALAVVRGDITLGGFVAFTTLAASASDWLSMLSQRLNNLRTRMASANRLLENTSDAYEEEQSEQLPTLVDTKEAALTVSDLSFAYEETPVLQEISLSVKRGEKIALVGGSGSGKSTLFKLIMGLYPIGEGSIDLASGSAPEEGALLQQLRQQISYLPQDSFLFPFTIWENITLEPWSIESESRLLTQVEQACCEAAILDFVVSLPLGFATKLSEAAENISGGQRQRIALARAIFQAAPLFLLDEATAALDPVSEEVVLRHLCATTDPRTVIFISHRPTVWQACQRIIVFEEGRIIEEGNFEELMAQNGALTTLYHNLPSSKEDRHDS